MLVRSSRRIAPNKCFWVHGATVIAWFFYLPSKDRKERGSFLHPISSDTIHKLHFRLYIFRLVRYACATFEEIYSCLWPTRVIADVLWSCSSSHVKCVSLSVLSTLSCGREFSERLKRMGAKKVSAKKVTERGEELRVATLVNRVASENVAAEEMTDSCEKAFRVTGSFEETGVREGDGAWWEGVEICLKWP